MKSKYELKEMHYKVVARTFHMVRVAILSLVTILQSQGSRHLSLSVGHKIRIADTGKFESTIHQSYTMKQHFVFNQKETCMIHCEIVIANAKERRESIVLMSHTKVGSKLAKQRNN